MWQIGLLAWIYFFATQIRGQVLPPPQITKFLSHDLVNPNEVKFGKRYTAGQNWGFRLPCEASGSNLQWIWEHNGSSIVFGAKYKLGGDGSLTGEYLEAESSGRYQCFVQDAVTSKKTFSRKLHVAVTYVEDFTSKVNKTETVIDLGQPFSVRCPQHEPNYGASYSWENPVAIPFKRDPHRAISPNGELFIMYVTQMDVDEIAGLKGIGCTVSAANTYYRSELFTLKKRTPDMVDPETKHSPSWKVTPKYVETATEGRSKTLYCFAIGRPAPTITWKKNGQQIIHGQSSFEIPDIFYGRRLNIANVKKDLHQDIYTCEAENSENSGRPLVHRINLNVKVPPRWAGDIPPPAKKNIDIQGHGTLLCNVVADPVPSYTWYKNGGRIDTSKYKVKVYNNTLEFKDVILEEDGVYQCVAENNLGMIVSSTWVNVRAMPPSFVKFGPFYLYKDREARLKCQPEAAPLPEFKWYKGGSEIIPTAHYIVLPDGTLVIDKVNKQDAGQYQCSAKNFLGEASANASAYVFEIPYPPTSLQISDTCHNRTAKLSWVTMASNDATILHFLVEQESNHEPNVFKLIYNITNPNATSVILNLTGWATLRFRVKAVTSLGTSVPSLPTEAGACRTSLGVPDKFPDNLRGVSSTKSGKLDINWTPMPKVDWNAPELYYILQYRKVKDASSGVWKEENITDPTIGIFSVRGPGQYEVWQFRICAVNDEGLGRFSAIEKSYFGQDAPIREPENVGVGRITASSVKISWTPVADSKVESIDGYMIYIWSESRQMNGKRRRRAIPTYATFTNVTGGKTQQTTVYGLKPYTKYSLAIKAYSCGGEGPSSDEVTFSTIGDGRPSGTSNVSSASPAQVSTTPTASSSPQRPALFSGIFAFVLAYTNILCHI